MPSDDEDNNDSDNEVFDSQRPYYGNRGSGDRQLSDQIEETADSEDTGDSIRPHTVSPSSSTTSSSLESGSPLDSLLSQLALITRQCADVLTTQYDVPIPEDLIDSILDLHPRHPVPRGPQPDVASGSQQSCSAWTDTGMVPQGQGSQQVSLIGAFFVIILMILARSQYPVPQ